MSYDPADHRKANHMDRLCDMCRQPMTGIMRESGEDTPRRICHACGGIQCSYVDEPKPID